MWDDEGWRNRVVQVLREMNDEADDLQVQHPTDHRRRRRLQYRSRFREPFGTALHRIVRTRCSRCNSRGSVLSGKKCKCILLSMRKTETTFYLNINLSY